MLSPVVYRKKESNVKIKYHIIKKICTFRHNLGRLLSTAMPSNLTVLLAMERFRNVLSKNMHISRYS